MKNYLDSLYNCNDNLGVKMFGVRGWNTLKGRVCGVTDSMINNPRTAAAPVKNDRRMNELFTALFRPNVTAGAELLGGAWVERVEDCALGASLSNLSDSVLDFVNSDKFKVGSDIFHNAANIFQHVPGYGKIVPAARKVTNTAADVLTSLGFGTKAETVQTAAKWGGVALLVGGGVAVWYFGFRKKKKGRRR